MEVSIRNRIRWGVPAALAVAALAVPASAGAHSTGADDELLQLAAAKPTKKVDVIVQVEAGKELRGPLRRVERLGGDADDPLPIIGGFGARLSAGQAKKLAEDNDVSAVTLDAPVAPQDVRASDIATAYPFAVNAPQTWNSSLPATGKGVGVAVIDT